MKENNKSILLAIVAVLSWSTVATAFKKSLENLSYSVKKIDEMKAGESNV